jgi:cellulose synthase/poly-beta-1,6-N-acetylglucosamine synthase-like glycosyltransferase
MTMPWWALAVLVLGANFALWGAIGLVRLAESGTLRWWSARWWLTLCQQALCRPALGRRAGPAAGQGNAPGQMVARQALQRPLTVDDVAVLIPAHNEALVIGESLRAIMALVPRQNVHVVSDGSADATVAIARQAGVHVIETSENLGKAGALEQAIGRFDLIRRFPVVMLLDADTRVQPGYFGAALPLLRNPEVVAVAGCVRTALDRKMTLRGNVLVGHRTRIYAIGQRALKFGQTYLRSNATPIVPGFASLYRTWVLPKMDMNPPGLVIEDFNMTFEVYQKRLGKVGFTLGAVAVTQDPDNIRDYVRQTKRWAVGLWQTVRRHPPRANLFTAMLTLLLLELITSSVLFVLLPLILLILAVPDVAGSALTWPWFADLHHAVSAHVKPVTVLFGVVVPDYLLTCAVALIERRPRLLLLGVFFPFLRIVDAMIALYAVPVAWLSRTSGKWKSPARRASVGPGPPPPPAVSAPSRHPAVHTKVRAALTEAVATSQPASLAKAGRDGA